MKPQSLLLERGKGSGGEEIPPLGTKEAGKKATLLYSFAVLSDERPWPAQNGGGGMCPQLGSTA